MHVFGADRKPYANPSTGFGVMCWCGNHILHPVHRILPVHVEQAYAAGMPVLGQALNIAVGVARGGTIESGGAIKS